MQNELKSSRAELAKLKKVHDDANEKLQYNEKEITILTQKLVNISLENEKFIAENKSTKKELIDQGNLLKDKTAACDQHSKELDDTKLKLEDFTKRLSASETASQNIKGELSGVQLELKQTLERLAEATENIKKLEVSMTSTAYYRIYVT